jgi:hypothetical protein
LKSMARVEVVPWSIARTYSFAILGLLSRAGQSVGRAGTAPPLAPPPLHPLGG